MKKPKNNLKNDFSTKVYWLLALFFFVRMRILNRILVKWSPCKQFSLRSSHRLQDHNILNSFKDLWNVPIRLIFFVEILQKQILFIMNTNYWIPRPDWFFSCFRLPKLTGLEFNILNRLIKTILIFLLVYLPKNNNLVLVKIN